MQGGSCILCDMPTPEWGIFLSGRKLYGPVSLCPPCWHDVLSKMSSPARARFLKPLFKAAGIPVLRCC